MVFAALLLLPGRAAAQAIAGSPEYIIALTAAWQGERFPDGRPKVPDDLLERLKHVTIEECWAELMKLGYQNQYEGDWMLLHDTEDAVMVGRAVTAQFMPLRPDLEDEIIEQGKKEGRMWQQKRDELEKEFDAWPNMPLHGDDHKVAKFEAEGGFVTVTLENTYTPTLQVLYEVNK